MRSVVFLWPVVKTSITAARPRRILTDFPSTPGAFAPRVEAYATFKLGEKLASCCGMCNAAAIDIPIRAQLGPAHRAPPSRDLLAIASMALVLALYRVMLCVIKQTLVEGDPQ